LKRKKNQHWKIKTNSNAFCEEVVKVANQQALKFEIPEDKKEISYSNQALITNDPMGFVFDFAQSSPQFGFGKIVGRIGMSPQHAKAFLQALEARIVQYEKDFGSISLTPKMVEKIGKFDKD